MHPYFDFDVLRNVTTRVGQTAFLHCRVEHLGDKSVSAFFFVKTILSNFVNLSAYTPIKFGLNNFLLWFSCQNRYKILFFSCQKSVVFNLSKRKLEINQQFIEHMVPLPLYV